MTPLLNIEETAKIIKISVSTIRRMIKEKEIPHLYIRGELRFREQDLEKWTNSRVIKTA